MPSNSDALLYVRVEALNDGPTAWGWAVYRGEDRFLILRSRPQYADRTDAIMVGLEAAKDIGRRLGIKVVLQEADLLIRELA